MWRRRTNWLQKAYIPTTKEAKTSLADFIHFANGDSCSETIVHWCLQDTPLGKPCCSSDEDSFAKLLSHVIPLFTKGFATPLLYRMKHFGPASSFVKVGCCLFRLLPRAVEEMQSTDAAPDVASVAETFLSEGGYQSLEADLQQLLADAMDMDRNYAAQNKVRRGQVAEEMKKPSFVQGIMVIDSLIQPIEYGVNTLLGHTKVIHDLQFLGRGHPKWADLKQKASDTFLHVVKGNFADILIGKYIDFLKNGLEENIAMGLDCHQELLNKVFQLIIMCVTDVHRRFKHDFSYAPLTLFELLQLDTFEFVQGFHSLQAQHHQCDACLDTGFSAKLVTAFPDIMSNTAEEQAQIKEEIQALLEDVTQWCPLTSDAVELKNGQTQWVASKRGSQNVKNPRVASETTLLQAVVKQHVWSQAAVGLQTMPSKRTSSGILKMSGVKSSKDKVGAFAGRSCCCGCCFVVVVVVVVVVAISVYFSTM